MQIPPRQRLFVIVLCAKPTASITEWHSSTHCQQLPIVPSTEYSARERESRSRSARGLCNLRCTAGERAARPSRRQALAKIARKKDNRIMQFPLDLCSTQSENFSARTSRPQPVNCRVWKTAGLAVQNDRVLIKHRSIFWLQLPHGCNCKSNRCTFVMIKYVWRTKPPSDLLTRNSA